MKKLIATLVVVVTMIGATWLVLRSSGPPAPDPHPQLDVLVAQCDAQGSSLAVAYDKVSARMQDLIGSDRATALAAVRGQIANVITGRLTVCEQALAIAQHDRRGLDVVRIGPFARRLEVAQAALRHLDGVLDGSGDAQQALDDLTSAVHAASGR